MPEPRQCRSCGEAVVEFAKLFDVFEQMHYVCFHYEFEHRGDRDVECEAGGCPAVGARTPSLSVRVEAVDLADGGNTVVPAILALRSLGFLVTRHGEAFVAELGSGRFQAEDPVALLGLVKLAETRRPWSATDAEVDEVLAEFGL